MDIVTISSRFHVVIPAALRKSLALRPGEKLVAEEHDGGIRLRRVRMDEYEGIVAGVDNDFEREPDRTV